MALKTPDNKGIEDIIQAEPCGGPGFGGASLKEEVIAAHRKWLKEGSRKCHTPGRDRPMEYQINPRFTKLRGASLETGRNLLSRLGFVEDETCTYGHDFCSRPSEDTANSIILISYHTPSKYNPHWHMSIIYKNILADLNLNGKVIGWHDDPFYKGVGYKDPNSTYYQPKRHIRAG